MEIINCEKKEMILLTDEETKDLSYEAQKVSHICKTEFCTVENEENEYKKIRDHWHYTGKFRGATYSTCNLNYKVFKKNSSNHS